jgi:hypothetical protein
VDRNGHVLEALSSVRECVEAKKVEAKTRERAPGDVDHAVDRSLTIKIFEDFVRFPYEAAVGLRHAHRPSSWIEPAQ